MTVETIRLGLFIALVFVLLMIWQAWQADHHAVRITEPPKANGEMDQIRGLVADQKAREDELLSEDVSPVAAIEGSPVWVETDLLKVKLDTLGGDPVQVGLKDYPVTLDSDSPLYQMLSSSLDRNFLVKTGLLSSNKAVPAPNHNSVYQATQTDYRLAEGQDSLEVEFRWQSEDLKVSKIWTFHRNSYLIDLRYQVASVSGAWKGTVYNQLLRSKGKDAEGNFFQPVSYQGGAFSAGEKKYGKVSFDDMADTAYKESVTGGWVAMIEHYFVAAVILDESQSNQVFAKETGPNMFTVGTVFENRTVEAGAITEFKTQLYAGPKEQNRLEAAANHLVLTVDFGILTALSQPLFWLLRWTVGIVGNWGISIILVTMLIKVLFYRLSAASYRSMAQMRKMNPKLVSLRERYADDKQMLNQKMMEMYREEKINPLGGCLPILIQIPVFIALYWVLLESVELRQAPFLGWIQDLSSADPYYVLPVLMGVSMLIQQRLSPAPLDPIQQKVMMVLPIVFTVFFALFPSGLVLYWVVNNILSITQQWYITRSIAA